MHAHVYMYVSKMLVHCGGLATMKLGTCCVKENNMTMFVFAESQHHVLKPRRCKEILQIHIYKYINNNNHDRPDIHGCFGNTSQYSEGKSHAEEGV